MPDLPARIVPLASSTPPRRERQVILARRRAEQGLLATTLTAHFDREAAIIEMEAAGAASSSALNIEVSLLKDGLTRANAMQSAAAAKVVGDRVQWLSATNDRILARRFG